MPFGFLANRAKSRHWVSVPLELDHSLFTSQRGTRGGTRRLGAGQRRRATLPELRGFTFYDPKLKFGSSREFSTNTHTTYCGGLRNPSRTLRNPGMMAIPLQIPPKPMVSIMVSCPGAQADFATIHIAWAKRQAKGGHGASFWWLPAEHFPQGSGVTPASAFANASRAVPSFMQGGFVGEATCSCWLQGKPI